MENYLYKVVLSAIIFNSKGEILLAKRSMDEDVLPGYWGISGGKVDATIEEQDILEKELQREIKEEVGVGIKDIKYLESHLGKDNKIQICFTCNTEDSPQALHETEEVRWVKLEEIANYKLTPHTKERVELSQTKVSN